MADGWVADVGGRGHARIIAHVQVFPLSDVKAYMGHADIATTMIYVHHVPQLGAAEKLSRALDAGSVPAQRSGAPEAAATRSGP